MENVATGEAEPLHVDDAGERHQLGDGQRRDRLARARLADDPDDLTATNVERHVADGMDVATRRRERDRQAGDGEYEVVVTAASGLRRADVEVHVVAVP